MAESFGKVLTDVGANIYEETWEMDSASIPQYDGPPWCITKFVLYGGKQHGVDIVELDNGEMSTVIVPTRGMGILEAAAGDVVLGWDSPVEEVVHPLYVQNESRGGLGWLEGFNELVCRCGLESHGAPGPDTIINNQGSEITVDLPLHGRIANTPASRVWVSVELKSPYRLTVGGEVNDTRMFGPNYSLRTAISTVPGSTEFTIGDEIQNVGGVPADMEILYHCNYGAPLLGEGARLVAPLQKLSARSQGDLEDIKKWDIYGPPQAGFVEQCYFFTLYGNKRGGTAVALVSADEEVAASIRFSTRQLPAFTLWKNTAAEADGYVTGLEPGTDYPNPRRFERERGRVIKLGPGQTHKTALTLGLVRGKSKVRTLRNKIAALAKGKGKQVCAELDPDMTPL